MDSVKPYTAEELQHGETYEVLYKATDGYWYRAKTRTCWFANGLLRQLEYSHARGMSERIDGLAGPEINSVTILESFITQVIHPCKE